MALFEWIRNIFVTQRTIIGISAGTMRTIQNMAENSHPDEFLAILVTTPAEDLPISQSSGEVITDLQIPPGAKSNKTSVRFNDTYSPINNDTIGSVHSHPNGSQRPSQEDLSMFNKGILHIIIGAPYESNTWKAYNSNGTQVQLDVVELSNYDTEKTPVEKDLQNINIDE